MNIAPWARTMAVLCPLLAAPLAQAGPDDYVKSPIVEEGEREIDFKTGTERLKDGTSLTATSLGLGWGVNSWWFTEVYGKWKREPGSANAFDALEWENRFQLAPTGKYPVDIGFLVEIERPKDRSEGYEFTYGPLLQKDWGNVQGNLNLLLQKNVRASSSFETGLHYETQLKYRASSQFEWGAQGFGYFGQWNKWAPTAAQTHQFGPAIFGKVKVGARQAIKYNAAVLFGLTEATPRTTFRLQTEYEF